MPCESARQAAAGQKAVGLIGNAGDKGLDLAGKDAPAGRADLPGKRICPVQKVQRPLQCAALFGPCERPPAHAELGGDLDLITVFCHEKRLLSVRVSP